MDLINAGQTEHSKKFMIENLKINKAT
jgi:hypothetical protein